MSLGSPVSGFWLPKQGQVWVPSHGMNIKSNQTSTPSWNLWMWSQWMFLIMGDTKSQLAISSSQARLPVEGLGCIQLSCSPKWSHRNPQTTQTGAKTEGCFLQTDSRVPLLRTTSTSLTEHERQKHGAFTPMFWSVWWGNTLQAIKRQMWTASQPQNP